MGHNSAVADTKELITELADLMQEFRLSEARLDKGGVSVAFRRRSAPKPAASAEPTSHEPVDSLGYEAIPEAAPSMPAAPKGTPVASPMTGIFYASPSPSAPAFVTEGGTISAGQIVGLIEAMKVFNEIPSPVSGTVLQMVAESGQLVNPGDVLMYVG